MVRLTHHEGGGPIEPFRFVQVAQSRSSFIGKSDWLVEIASMFGLGSTLRPRGWPRSEKKSCLSLFFELSEWIEQSNP